MNQIGFKNFRRFKDLKPQSLGDITILVGANNAGKSTLVKGLLLILDNLRTLKIGGGDSLIFRRPEFRFDANDYHDLGIGTFGRALYNKASKDMISFSVRLTHVLNLMDDSGNTYKRNADFSVLISVTGDRTTDQTTGTISRIGVSDNNRGIKFDFDYDSHKTTLEFATRKSSSSDMRKKLQARIAQLEEDLKTYYDESQKLKAQISEKQKVFKETAVFEVELNEKLAYLSKENAELVARMASIDASDPRALREIEEISVQMEVLKRQQRELRSQMAHGDDLHIKEELARLNSMSNSTLMKIADRNAELDKLHKSLELLSQEETEQSKSTKIELGINTVLDKSGVNFIVNQINSVISLSSMSEGISDEDKVDPQKLEQWQNQESDKAYIHERSGILNELSEDLSFTISGISAEYIYAHSASQNIFYNTADKNDYMAKAIHRYYREMIVPGSTPHTFVKTWMKKFGIGDDFEIVSFGGEAYRFYIYEGKEKMDLADKGMGSNQLMILLISLASMIRKYEHTYAKPFVIIEEPEQNLHPDLQRMLTELLAYVNENYKFKFIVETHSEYMIRRSQVLVSEGEFKNEKDLEENCPFRVYYFPKDGEPYDMEYTITGRFGKQFGKNFYDASARDAVELNKREIASRNK